MRQANQGRIACGMAVGVVDLLKVVNVHHQQADRLSGFTRQRKAVFGGIDPVAAVGNTGETIGLCLHP